MLYLPDKLGYFLKLSKGSKTLVMTSEMLGEMFESEFVDTCDDFFPLELMGGLSGRSSVCRPGSEDTHRRQRKFADPY
jgi:hypothetical protein